VPNTEEARDLHDLPEMVSYADTTEDVTQPSEAEFEPE